MTSATHPRRVRAVVPGRHQLRGARCSAGSDMFIIWDLLVTAIGLGVLYQRKTAPIFWTLHGDLRRDRAHRRDVHEGVGPRVARSKWNSAGRASARPGGMLACSGRSGSSLSSVIVLLGAVAGANFYFKKKRRRHDQRRGCKKRDLEAIVTASGTIQAKRFREHQRRADGSRDPAGRGGRRPREGGPVPRSRSIRTRCAARCNAARPRSQRLGPASRRPSVNVETGEGEPRSWRATR